MSPEAVFDLVLPAALVVLAEATLRQRQTSEALVQFMVFGLLTAIAWTRVDAPDLALTETAIGSGVTGALLLAALRRLKQRVESPEERVDWRIRLPVELGCAFLGVTLSWILVRHWPGSHGLTQVLEEALPRSGGANPVTAVVLNFRAWDTLLEMGVLLAAVLCVYAVGEVRHTPHAPGVSVVFRLYLFHMTPLFILMILYLNWIGADAPGGAFPAGALLAGLGVLTMLGPQPPSLHPERFLVRNGLVLGAALFIGVGVAAQFQGEFLQYPEDAAKWLILLIELGCTLSIGLSFTVLFAACAGRLDRGTGAP